MNWDKIDVIAKYILVIMTIWFLVSWADVLLHQFNGDLHWWNCIVLYMEVLKRW